MSPILTMWQNGGRPLVLSMAAVLLTLTTLTLVTLFNIYAVVTEPAPYAPLSNVNPQVVLNPDSTVVQGGSLFVSGVKCNTSDRPVTVTSASHFRRVDERGSISVEHQRLVASILPPGCLTRVWENALPLSVTPGTWVLEGFGQVSRGSEVQMEGWITGEFEVIAAEGQVE